MEKLIQLLYEEIHEPKVSPQDLLKNLELDNYHDVLFKKENNYIIATVLCDLANNEPGEFKYSFLNNKLESLIQISPHVQHNILYDRNTEIQQLRSKISKTSNNESITSLA